MKAARLRSLIAVASLLALATIAADRHAVATASKRTAVTPVAAVDARDEAVDASLLTTMRWRPIGPARFGGRVTDFAVVESNTSIVYVGTASGGVLKTTSLGAEWEPVFDNEGCASIGDVAVAPSNPEVIWVGTGEANNRQSVSWGNGLYRSTDGGQTWQHLGLDETRHIGRIVVHPTNPDVAFVAAVGHLWGPNPERGVFRTTDGGKTWRRVLFVNDDTGANDIAMDPANPKVLYAAMYQRRRAPWGFNGGGRGGGIYRSRDGGETWVKLARGLPAGDLGRIGLDVYRRDPRVVYARVEAHPPAGGIYRSRDGGEAWEQMSSTNPRPMYFGQIRIDPNNANRIYVGGRTLLISDDGGRTFREDGDRGVHSDHHALWIDPRNSNFLLLGTDGGVFVSFDRSEHWRMLDNLPIGQFYKIAVDMRDPYHVCGGLQDNGSWCGPSATRHGGGIANADWINVGGADGFYPAIDPVDHTIVFAESQDGGLIRIDLATGERERLQPRPPSGSRSYRWNWNTPMVMSAHDPATLYIGANVLLSSTNRGYTWQEASGDLTRQLDRSRLPIMGIPSSDKTLSRDDGVTFYGTITTIAESPLDPKVIYLGTDDGNVQRTRDGGRTWTNLTGNIPALPDGAPVSRVVASTHEPARVYAAFDGHAQDDYAPYVFVSEDYGQTWQPIVAGLPSWSVNVLAEHPRAQNVLFLGNEIGVYLSIDRGRHWTRLKNNLPTVPVDDLLVHPRDNDLIAGTHGRGIWILDDITPLEYLSRVLTFSAHLFPVRTATIFNYPPPANSYRVGVDPGPRYFMPVTFAAPNPPVGAVLRYYLGQRAPDGKVGLVIADATGEPLRTLQGSGERGVQEVVWDLRLAPRLTATGGLGGGNGGAVAPRVLPGTYTVRLEVGGQRVETPLTVRLDPRVRVIPADLQARQKVMMDLYELAPDVDSLAVKAARLARDLAAIEVSSVKTSPPPAAALELAKSMAKDAQALARSAARLRAAVVSAFTGLDSAHFRPRPDELRVVAEARVQTRTLVEQLNRLIQAGLSDLNSRLESSLRIEPGR